MQGMMPSLKPWEMQAALSGMFFQNRTSARMQPTLKLMMVSICSRFTRMSVTTTGIRAIRKGGAFSAISLLSTFSPWTMY